MRRKLMGTWAPAALLAGLFVAGQARAGLVAEWDFNQTSGATAHAQVGAIDGTLIGGAGWAPGQGLNGGSALILDAAHDGYVTMGQNFAFTSGDFSIMAWIKTTTASNIPVAKHHSGFGNGYFLATGNVGDGVMSTGSHFYDSGPGVGDPNTSVTDGSWHQLVGVYHASGSIEYYVDGALHATGGTVTIQPNDADFTVGAIRLGNSYARTYTGLVNNVALWDNALTAQNVSSIYTKTTVGAPEPSGLALLGIGAIGLVGYRWRRKAH